MFFVNQVSLIANVISEMGLREDEVNVICAKNSENERKMRTVVKAKLPWVHVVIGRCRDGIAAIHREVDKQFLQLYLNEFCWKFNRRFFRDSTDPKYDLFDRLVSISASYTSDIKWRDYEITNDDDLY